MHTLLQAAYSSPKQLSSPEFAGLLHYPRVQCQRLPWPVAVNSPQRIPNSHPIYYGGRPLLRREMEATTSVSSNWNWQVVLVKWEVVVRRGKKYKRKKVTHKEFPSDLAGAMELYTKAIKSGLDVRLRCMNIGFPPPATLRPYTQVKRFRDKRTRKIVKREVAVDPMMDHNHNGLFWCPYCMKLEEFVRQEGVRVLDIEMNELGFCCPACGINHRNHHVRKYNPLMLRIAEDFGPKVRSPRGTGTRRRRR